MYHVARSCRPLFLLALAFLPASVLTAADAPLQLVFLGDNGPHRPAQRFAQLAPQLEQRGIHLTYTDDVNILSEENLTPYDGLVLYANIDTIEMESADALLQYVASGKGFIPLHSATFCFRNDARIIALMGAQFQRHGTGVFTTELAEEPHPILEGFNPFSSWDETYVHHLHHQQNRVVLEYRRGDPQAEGNEREPWTWVRTHGAGRVFYTAWGHDHRTWSNPGFHNLVERGIRWACGGDPTLAGELAAAPAAREFIPPPMTPLPAGESPFDYVDVGPQIPNYAAGRGQTLQQMQKPLPAAESIKRFVTPADFRVELFADESIFQSKPIAMNWDEQGRLWVCETVDYPHDLQRNNVGRDRIRICEDTDGDGKADTSTVFAEGLNIPTAIAFHRGGAVVQNGTETLYLKDTDGDGKADLKHVLLSGWNLGDTHGGVSNFRNGLDNWIYAMQGYNNSAPQIDGVPQQSFRMGFFRFKLSQTDPPQVEQMEFLRSTTNNTWGLGISEEGLIFGSTANREPSFFLPIPNRYYERVGGWAPETLAPISDTHLFKPISDKVRQVDHHGGYTAAAGHAIYTARAYPPQWWNRTALVCGPTGKLVGTFVLQPDGAGFRSHSPINLLASDDEWSAPIMAEVGPDGQVWVIDWYNYIVQHNPTPEGFETGKGNAYLTDLRDKRFGRVYRVIYQGDAGRSTAEVPRLSSDDLPGLLAALSHPTMLVRLSAQRLLVERGQTDCVSGLIERVADKQVDEIGLNVAAIHALHVLAALGTLKDVEGDAYAAVVDALQHPSAGVRRNAVSVLTDTDAAAKALIDARLLEDADPQVLLAALLAIADTSGPNLSAPLADFVASERIEDRWLADAATSAAARRPERFLVELAKRSAHTELADNAITVSRRVAEHYARSAPAEESAQRLLAALVEADARLISGVASGLAAGWPNGHALASNNEGQERIKTLFRSAGDQAKADLIQLTSRSGSAALDAEKAEVARVLLRDVLDEQADTAQRLAAAGRLIAFDPGNTEVLQQLVAQINPLAAPELARGLIIAIGNSTAPEAAEQLVQVAKNATPAVRDQAVQTLLSRPAMTQTLLASLEAGELAISDLTALQRQSLSDHRDRGIRSQARELFQSAGTIVDPDRQRVVEEKLHLASKPGDAAAGKLVFTKNCATCHQYHGEGTTVGPDLTGMSVHPKSELLLHILDPSRSVESNYRLYTALTVDGVVINGILAAESRTSVEIVDAQARRHTILREDLEELVASRKSAMPEGLEESMGDQGITDLLEYLTTKGEFVPLPIDQVATVLSTRGMFYDENSRSERLVFDNWGPKIFNGVPFVLVDPQNAANNAILLHSPNGKIPPTMPRSVMLPCETAARRIHLLGGVAGWAAQGPGEGPVAMIVRLHYLDGQTEDHRLIDGQHVADYIGRFEVPQSTLAFDLGGRQLRYLAIEPQRREVIKFIEFVKPDNHIAPIVMAVTVQTPTDH